MAYFVSQDPRSYSFYLNYNIWFRALKVIGTLQIRAPERDSNPGPPDYECKALTTRPRCLLPFDDQLCITISVVWLQRLQCHGLGWCLIPARDIFDYCNQLHLLPISQDLPLRKSCPSCTHLCYVALDDLVVLVTDRRNSLHFEYWSFVFETSSVTW